MTITFDWNSVLVILALVGLGLGGAKLYGDTRAWMAKISGKIDALSSELAIVKKHVGLNGAAPAHEGD